MAPSNAALPLPADVYRPDSDWITRALQGAGLDVEVSHVRVASIGEGVGMMSGLARLDLTFSRGAGPATLIAKTPATNAANLGVATAFDLYRREVLFYRDLAQRTTARVPHIYYAEIADDGVNYLLLMEDLAHLRLGDQVEGCGLDEAIAGVEWLGRHHASFWGRTDEDGLDFLPPVLGSYHNDALVQGFGFGWDPMLEAFDEVIPDRYRAMKDLYLEAQPLLFAWMGTPPLTVAHGDFRMDNLFFDSTPGVDPLLALDWQGALRGRGTQDLAYFLTGSVQSDVRRAHHRDLVNRWHARLCADGVTGYSQDDAWEDYRRAVAFVWTIAVVIAGTLDRTNERANAWMSVMLQRSIEAMDEVDVHGLLVELTSASC